MSFKLGGIVTEDLGRGISAHEKLILICYSSFAWKDGTSIYPSQAAIAEMAMCKPRMVRKARDKFLADGVFVEVGKRGLRKEYRLDIDRAIEVYGRVPKAAPDATLGADGAAQGAASSQARDAGDVAYDDSKAAPDAANVAPSARNPVINTSKNPVDEPGARASADDDGAASPRAGWDANFDALGEAVGEEVCKLWLPLVVPVKDFAGRLTLAVPSRMIFHKIDGVASEIERVLDRKVEVIIRTDLFPDGPAAISA